MALIKCPECGKEISDQVKKCPGCGYPVKKELPFGKIALIAVGCVAAAGVGYIIYNQNVIKPRTIYNEAVYKFNQCDYSGAEYLFSQINNYQDSDSYIEKISNEKIYQDACSKFESGDLDSAEELFNSISDYSDSADKISDILNTRIYNDGIELYNQKEYAQALDILEPIKDFSDVSAIIDQMNADYEFNDYIDRLKNYGFMAESVELMGVEAIDELTNYWYDSIYEKDDSETDTYNSYRSIFDDSETSLTAYYESDDYAKTRDKLTKGKALVDEAYSDVKNLPDGLKDCASKLSAVQAAYTSLVDYALDVQGSLTTVQEFARNKNDAFNTAYIEFKLSIPDKLELDPSIEEVYDFRSMNFGMNIDEVIEAEKKVYGNTGTFNYYLSYDDILIDGFDKPVSLVYSTNSYRIVRSARVSMPKGTTADDALKFVSSLYGDRFDGNELITAANEYPYIFIYIGVYEDDTIVYFSPLTQEDYDELSKEPETEEETMSEGETEEETMSEEETEEETISEEETEKETEEETISEEETEEK